MGVGRAQYEYTWRYRFNDIPIVETPVVDHNSYYIVHPNQFERFANQSLFRCRVLSAINALSGTNDNAPS